MDKNSIIQLLEQVKSGETLVNEAFDKIRALPFSNLDFARVDTHRNIRQGFSEAVYCPGKTPEQIVEIMKELKISNYNVLATRATAEIATEVLSRLPEASYDPESRIIKLGDHPEVRTKNFCLIITAGTTDIPVAKEAIETLKSNGVKTESLFDCGVAGAHRIFNHIEIIQKAKAIIAIAGMEGALASIIGGISSCPVIAVPTSNGYGTNFQGLTPLLSMLNSCTSCVSVVNIDNGYSAGIIASLIVHQSEQITL